MIGVAIAAGLAFMIWDAAHSQGLLIEPFSVPPDMAAKGLTGQVVASQLLDKLTPCRPAPSSHAPAAILWQQLGRRHQGRNSRDRRLHRRTATASCANGWATTPISAAKSGAPPRHRRHRARQRQAGETVTGAEADLDGLMQKAAEIVYRITQPYRYANFLDRNAFRPGAPLRIAEAERSIAG